jgi:hypothetical protein
MTDMTKLWKQVQHLPNVIGYSGELRPRIQDGKEVPGTRVFRVYVIQKIDTQKLKPKQLIPLSLKLNDQESVETDVVEMHRPTAPPWPKPVKLDSQGRIKKEEGDPGKMALEAAKKAKQRPASAGCSAIYNGGTACTLGWFAKDKVDGKLVIIANNHCTANENRLPFGASYMQPSPYDGLPSFLGILKRFVPIKFARRCLFGTKKPLNRVDVGVVSVDPSDILLEIIGIGAITGKRRGKVGEMVMKSGRTTCFTTDGLLIDDAWYGEVGYSSGAAIFGPCGLIQKTGFSAGGDSSSAIITQTDKKFAGLLFAGSDTHTIFCHYDFIETDANLEIIW